MHKFFALAGALEIVATTYNAGNKVKEGILDNLAEGHEGADVLLLGMQEFQEASGESMRLGMELWAEDRAALADRLTADVQAAAAACARKATAAGVDLTKSVPSERQSFAAKKLAAACALSIQRVVDLFQEAYPNAKWAGENSGTHFDADCEGCDTRFHPRWNSRVGGWMERLTHGDLAVLLELDEMKVGPESFEARYYEEASAFQFGCLIARGGTHFYTDMRVFLRPGSTYRFDLIGSETVSKIRGQECGKVIQYIVLKAKAPETRDSATPLQVGDRVQRKGMRGVGVVASVADDGAGSVDFPTRTVKAKRLADFTRVPNERKLCLMNTHLSFASASMQRADDIHTTLNSILSTAKCDTTVFVGDFNTRLHCEPHDNKVHYSLLPAFARSRRPNYILENVCEGESCSLRDSEVGEVERWDELRQFLTKDRVRCYEKIDDGLDLNVRRTGGHQIYRDDWGVECKCGLDTGEDISTMPGSLFQHSGPAEDLDETEAEYKRLYGTWQPCGEAAAQLCDRVQEKCEVPSSQKSKAKWFKGLFGGRSRHTYEHYCKYHPKPPPSPQSTDAEGKLESGEDLTAALPPIAKGHALVEVDAKEHLVRRVQGESHSQVAMGKDKFVFEDYENPGIQNLGFEEPFGRAPKFAPTYKIAKSKDDLSGLPCIGGTCYINADGKAKHNPAFTDRIIVQSSDRVDMTARKYNILPLHKDFGSDHLPVQTALSIEFVDPLRVA